MVFRKLLVAGTALLVGCAHAPGQGSPTSDAAFARLTQAYLEAYYVAHPLRATSLGIHEGDARLPNLSVSGMQARATALRKFLGQAERIDSNALQEEAQFDLVIMKHTMRAELLEIETVRGWQKNPNQYNRMIAGGVASLVDRQFAPTAVRVESLIGRFEGISAVTAAAKANLQDVPQLWAQLAVRATRGTVIFLKRDVPAALHDQGYDGLDSALKTRFERAHRQSIQAVESFANWLENDLLPRANGDYRLGREVFEKKLFYEEHFRLSADELRAMNDAAIVRYQQWVKEEAAKIDPNAAPADVMKSVTEQHPPAEALLKTAKDYVVQARDFVVERGLVTLPSNDLPIIRETPRYARFGFASMSTPGPFEQNGTEAYYNITNVEPDWTEEKKHQHLTYFNYPGLLGISIHEAMPGHFVQLLYQSRIPTDLRKVFATRALIEGWAHYVEQMMLDEGLENGDPRVRLAQLRRALQRHARWHAAIAIHVDSKSIDEAAKQFERIAYFAPFPALRETQRATYNPTYLYYALGRMEILSLREAYASKMGKAYSLRDFHDRFLTLGLPIPLARRALLESSGR